MCHPGLRSGQAAVGRVGGLCPRLGPGPLTFGWREYSRLEQSRSEPDATLRVSPIGCVEQSRLVGCDPDAQAFSTSSVDVYGLQLAALDHVQHGLSGQASALAASSRLSQPSGTSGRIRLRRSWSMRMRQGAPGVICSAVMKPSRIHR